MKLKSWLALSCLVVLVIVWNLKEIENTIHAGDESKIPVPEDVSLPEINWDWFNKVKVEVNGSVCKLVSLPAELEQLEGQEVVVSGPTFACGEDLIEHEQGYTINGFVMVPYFGMIDCCVGNPIPYYQWTVVVERLKVPWEINHKGTIDPNAVVKGTLRIRNESDEDGIFFLENAEVITSRTSPKE